MNRRWLVRHGGYGAALAALALALGPATAWAQQTEEAKNTKPKVAFTELVIPVKKSDEKSDKKSDKTESKKKAPTGAAPKIAADNTTHDFGEVWAGKDINHTFVIKNTGQEILKITRVKPSCGCTVAQKYDREIKPGATGKIQVTVRTARLRSKITKSIRVESNDTTKSPFVLKITGTVKERYTVDPVRGGNFGRISPDDKLERTLTLTNNMDEPVELKLAASKVGVFNAELIEKTPGRLYEFVVRAQPPYADKVNRGSFKLTTSLDGKTSIDIRVSAFVPPRVEVSPPVVLIPRAQKTARKQNVRVKFNSDTQRKVLSATTNAKDVEVEVKKTSDSSYNVTLAFPANYLPPPDGAMLTITTDDPKKPKMEVRIAQTRNPKRRAPARPSMQLSGKPVPDATFKTADGKKVATAEMKDDATLMMFYTSWCGFCKRTLPKLDALKKEYEGKSVNIVGVNMDSLKEDGATGKRARTKKSVTDQWKDLGGSLTQLFDSNKDGLNKFKVQSFPTMFLLGKTGKVERVYMGGGAANDGSLKRDMDTLLAGKKLATTTARKPRERPALKMAGKPAPKVTFRAASDDSTVSLTGSDAEATVAFFYASWCGYCKKTLPKLSEMSEAYKGKPVRFVGVNQDTIVEKLDPKNRRAKTKEYVVKQWADLGVKFQQVLDPQRSGSKDFKVSSFPTFFLIDKNGKIDKAYIGGNAITNGTLKKNIDTLLAGKTVSKATNPTIKLTIPNISLTTSKE
ncbi:MAG: redoxin family protein [Phycisphaerae bacterium]